MLSALLVLFGLYFAWDAYRSSRTGLSNDQWGVQFSRAEAPSSFWITIFIEAALAFVAVALAIYVAGRGLAMDHIVPKGGPQQRERVIALANGRKTRVLRYRSRHARPLQIRVTTLFRRCERINRTRHASLSPNDF